MQGLSWYKRYDKPTKKCVCSKFYTTGAVEGDFLKIPLGAILVRCIFSYIYFRVYIWRIQF